MAGRREKEQDDLVADDPRRVWKLGGRVSENGRHSCSFLRDLSEAEVQELRAKFKEIDELAEQRAIGRVVESSERWNAILDAAENELETDGALSDRSQRAALLELNAFSRLGQRLIEQLGDAAAELPDHPKPQADDFGRRLTRIRRSGPQELLAEAFRDQHVPADLLRVRNATDPLFVRGFEAYGARNLPVAAMGWLIDLLVAYFALREPSYRALAAEMKQLTLSVPRGLPSIFSYVDTYEEQGPGKIAMIDFPIPALVRLDAAFDGVVAGDGVSALAGLFRDRDRRRLFFGAAAADSGAIGGETSTGINAVPTATVGLDVDLLGSEPIDYWAPVRDRLEEGGEGRDMFVGSVCSATPEGRLVSLRSEAALAAAEQLAGGSLAANMEPNELIRSLFARAGWQGEMPMDLSGEVIERDPERFEVVVPLYGLEVTDEVRVGAITLIPRNDGFAKVEQLGDGDLREVDAKNLADFRSGQSFALAEPTVAMVHEAEERGLADIDLALAWLTARGRYGAIAMPDGRPQIFNRELSLRSPSRGTVVFVIAVETKRLWLRQSVPRPSEQVRRICAADLAALPLPAQLEASDRLALLALRLAASEINPLMQVRALWQAIESYTEGQRGEQKLFDGPERQAIKKLLLDEKSLQLDQRQRERLSKAIDGLNNVPLNQRLERQLKEDGVLVTPDELALLKSLYDVRNDIVHGRTVEEPPPRDCVNYGISIVARILVHRIDALDRTDREP